MLQGDLVIALADLSKAIELNDKNDKAWTTRGEIRLLQGDLVNVLADLSKAIELNDKNDFALLSKSKIYNALALKSELDAFMLNPTKEVNSLQKLSLFKVLTSIEQTSDICHKRLIDCPLQSQSTSQLGLNKVCKNPERLNKVLVEIPGLSTLLPSILKEKSLLAEIPNLLTVSYEHASKHNSQIEKLAQKSSAMLSLDMH